MNQRCLHSLGPSKIIVWKVDFNINKVGYHVQCLNREYNISFSEGTGINYWLIVKGKTRGEESSSYVA